MGRMRIQSPDWLAQAKFSKECRIDERGCWIRPKAKRSPDGWDINGYRRAYRLWGGTLPTRESGQQVEHRCGRGNQGCVNPHHLVLVSASENTIRGYIRTNGQMSTKQLRVARYLHRKAVDGA